MDDLDEDILATLIDGKPRNFNQLLKEIHLSHNTLRLHLDRFVDQKLVTREKAKRTGRGRPVYLYSLGSGGRKAALMFRSGVEGVVSLPFVGLAQVCRFEKGGFCKRIRVECEARVCPQISKWV
jgi:DNA-binding MarR family transcriptional regulator